MKHRKRLVENNSEWAGWELTPDEVDARQKRAPQPFWANWSKERIDSIQELYDIVTLYCGGQRAQGFNPSRVKHHPSRYLTAEQRAQENRLVKWIDKMNDAGLRDLVISRVVATIIVDDRYPDQGQFLTAIDLHVAIRRKDVTKSLTRRRSND